MNKNLTSFVISLTLVIGSLVIPRHALAQVPPNCDGSSYDCIAVNGTPWIYTHNTCGTHEYRASEAESLQDELNEWNSPSICNLTTERIGWYTTLTTVGFCGTQSNEPKTSWGIEVGNVSKYTFHFNSPCSDPPKEQGNNAVIRDRDPFCPLAYSLYNPGGTNPTIRCRRESVRIDADKTLGKPKGKCCGNPINTAIANKYQEETDYQGDGIGGLILKRYYNSGMDWDGSRSLYYVHDTWETSPYLGYGTFVKLAFQTDANQHQVTAIDSIGAQWRHYYQRGIYVNSTPTFTYENDG